MADGLAEALLGLNVPASQSPYAIGQQALAQSTPQLITPYTPTGQAIGISLGSALLQTLMGYQARKNALQDTLQANTLANQMLKMQTPEERTSFIQQQDVSPVIGSRLSDLATALTAQERARQAEVDLLKQKKIAELTAPAEFYATPEGAASWKNELTRIQEESLAKYAGLRSPSTQPKAPSFWESIQPADRVKIVTSQGQISTIRDLANTFEKIGGNALTLQTQSKLNPQSPENLALAKLNILVPSTARLMGEVGNLAQPEQERLINATLGSIISGPKAIAARLRQLADTAEGIINSKTTAYKAAFETGGEAMLSDGITTSAVDAKLKKLAELKAQLAELKAKRGAP